MHRMMGRALLFLATVATVVIAAPATQPSIDARVEQLLQKLDSDAFAEREAAAAELDSLPAEALPLLEAATKKPTLSPDVRTALTAPIARLRRTVSKQTGYQANLAFYQQQLTGEYDRVGQKDPKWDAAARKLLDEAAKYSADTLSHRQTTDAVFEAAAAVRKLKVADPLIRGLVMEFDNGTKALKPAVDLWPKLQASGYSNFRKASHLRLIIEISADNKSPSAKDTAEVKKFVTQAAELWAQILRDEKFPTAVAIPQLTALLAHGRTAGVDVKEAWDLLDQRLTPVLGEEHLVRLNLKGFYLLQLATDQRTGGGANWEQSMRSLDEAARVLKRAYELFPSDGHAATTMIDVLLMNHGGEHDQLETWFDRAIKADPENYEAWSKRVAYMDDGEDEHLTIARQALATGHFETRIPLLIVTAHEDRDMEEPPAWASAVPKPYYARDDVWADITAAYEGFLRVNPDADEDREAYLLLAYNGGHWSTVAEQLKWMAQQPDWDDRNVDMVRLIGLELPLRQAEPKQRPDYRAIATQRDREDYATMRRLTVDAYEVVGRKNPKWDAPARETLIAFAKLWSGDPDRQWDETGTILKLGKTAIDAGCDDPLVRFAHAWVVDVFVTPQKPAVKLVSPEAMKALLASEYAEAVKVGALTHVVSCRLGFDPKPDKATKADCVKQLEAAIPLLPAIVSEKQARPEYVSHMAGLLLYLVNRADGDVKAFYDRVNQTLEQAKLEPFALQEVKAWYLWQKATRAVPDHEGKKGEPKEEDFAEYRKLAAEASEFAESLWKQQPTRSEPLDLLLQIASYDGDEDRIKFWLRQAALVDPDSRLPGDTVLVWSQWAENIEDEARAAAATDAYVTQLPFLLVDYHVKAASMPEAGKPPPDLPNIEQISQEDVWMDISGVFEAYLAKYPNDYDRRSEYASLACRANQWVTAIEQFKQLGDNVRPKAFVTAERLEACKKKAAALEKITSQTPAVETP